MVFNDIKKSRNKCLKINQDTIMIQKNPHIQDTFTRNQNRDLLLLKSLHKFWNGFSL